MRKIAALLFFIAIILPGAVSAQQASVRVVRDLDFVANTDYAENRDKLDLYLPEARQRFPVVISIYGGALTAGEKSKHAYVGQRFAAAGFGTAVINYRLSPAVSHPAHIQDAAAAFAWVKQHIGEYGGDPNAILSLGIRRALTWRRCSRLMNGIWRRTNYHHATCAAWCRSALLLR
jgi:acetyl esterase/lipase